MKKLILISLCLTVLILFSCNKDQRAVKKLEGKWQEQTINGQTIADSSKSTVEFTNCKLKDNEWCTATFTDSDGNAITYDYKVSGKGTILTYGYQDSYFGSIQINSTIEDLTKTKLVLKTTFFTTQTVEYIKI
ncbi:MAG: hypothetical protein HUJ25_14780 [Crocinitomicaceae bacterium]|nr:hypothetical protein [Crocinitomicaceae bacterium]